MFMSLSFQIGIILGIGGMVNLFIMFVDQEFSLIWLLFSLAVVIGSDIWLLSRGNLKSDERKEVYWAKHGVWSVGILAILFGLFKNMDFTLSYMICTFLMILAVIAQFTIYRYRLISPPNNRKT